MRVSRRTKNIQIASSNARIPEKYGCSFNKYPPDWQRVTPSNNCPDPLRTDHMPHHHAASQISSIERNGYLSQLLGAGSLLIIVQKETLMGNQKGLKRDFKALEARRLQAISLITRSMSKAEVARCLGVSAQSVGRWHSAWLQKGSKALLAAARAGRHSRVQPGQRIRFESLLRTAAKTQGTTDGTPWTLNRLADAVREELGFNYHPAHLSRLLRHRGLTLPRQRRELEVVSNATSRRYPTHAASKANFSARVECPPVAWRAAR